MRKSRIIKDKVAHGNMFALTIIAILMVVVIAIGLYLTSAPVLENKSLWSLLFSSEWRPMKGEFGFLPFIMGTIWVTILAILIALPISLLTAIYLTEYSKPVVRKFVFPALDILAALPSHSNISDCAAHLNDSSKSNKLCQPCAYPVHIHSVYTLTVHTAVSVRGRG